MDKFLPFKPTYLRKGNERERVRKHLRMREREIEREREKDVVSDLINRG